MYTFHKEPLYLPTYHYLQSVDLRPVPVRHPVHPARPGQVGGNCKYRETLDNNRNKCLILVILSQIGFFNAFLA